MLDLMRLPLGILTGMGFIGGGAILRKGEMVHGVTTAATLWLVTVIGLCLGGGQVGLGIAATVLAIVVLWMLKRVEALIGKVRNGRLYIVLNGAGPTDEEIQSLLVADGFQITSWGIVAKRRRGEMSRTITCGVKWHGRAHETSAPAVIEGLTQQRGVNGLRWQV